MILWPKPVTLLASVAVLGLVLFGLVLWVSGWFGLSHWFVVLGYLALWYIFAVWVFVPIAVIAQAVRNKRHGVFSHLKQATTKDVRGGINRDEER